MALKAVSLFVYGIQVTELNRSIDFKADSMGPVIQATLALGFYSVSGLAREIKRAMDTADLNNTYTVTVDRSINGGRENRINIATSGSFLSLLFSSGPRAVSSVCELAGFDSSDYTGDTDYTGTVSCGLSVLTTLPGNEWVSPDQYKKNFGTLNVTPSGRKESIVYSTQRFWQIRFNWISEIQLDDWSDLLTWLISQKPIDFTPEITTPELFYEGSLESTPQDQQGLSFQLPERPPGTGLYDTGLLKFRVRD